MAQILAKPMEKKKSLFDFKDVINLGDKRCCPPHHLPHKLPMLHEPVIDEPCHTHKSIMHRMHHNFFCKFLKCPNYKFMMEQTKNILNSNHHKNMKTVLIVGLGNPGKEYRKTRHNTGFMFVDFFRNENRDNFSDWKADKKLKSEVSVGKIGGKKIILLKPQTFMNLSGEAILATIKFYKIPIKDLAVIHDEIDLPLGIFRFSKDSSAAGHKGAQSVIERLRTKEFTRLRLGVDNRTDKNKISTEKYVLGKFTSTELRNIKNVLDESADELLKHIS